jgi:cytochrome c biogenesis protein CcmG/thiol:disulfide interchange protein DsbE
MHDTRLDRILAPVIAAASLLVAAGCASTAGAGGGDGQGQEVGKPLPKMAVSRLDGAGEIRFSSLRGKVVLIDIWASWCAPCKEEMPLLDDIARRMRGKVQVIAVSIDEERANARAFLESRPRWSLTLAHDPDGRVPDLLKPLKMPTSYVVDRKGVVRAINSGFERGDAARLEAQLVALSAESD